MNKLKSRKFWISIAAFLGSISASIAGLVVSEKWITITGIVCGILSAAIYTASEAYVDGHSVASNTTSQVINSTTINKSDDTKGKK